MKGLQVRSDEEHKPHALANRFSRNPNFKGKGRHKIGALTARKSATNKKGVGSFIPSSDQLAGSTRVRESEKEKWIGDGRIGRR
jgi:hypothetical protein